MQITSSKVFPVLLIGSFVLAVTTTLTLHADIRQMVPVLLTEAFLIFLSAVIVERTLVVEANQKAHERTEMLADRLDSSVRQVIMSSLNDARYAADYDVHILPPRRSYKKYPGVTYKVIADAIREAEWVKIFCTAGLDVFPPVNAAVQRDSVADVIQQRSSVGIQGSQGIRPFTISILSAAPDGEYAKCAAS